MINLDIQAENKSSKGNKLDYMGGLEGSFISDRTKTVIMFCFIYFTA